MSPSFNDLVNGSNRFPKNGTKFVLNENGANELSRRRCLKDTFVDGNPLFFNNGRPISKGSQIVWMRIRSNDVGLIGIPRGKDYFKEMITPSKKERV